MSSLDLMMAKARRLSVKTPPGDELLDLFSRHPFPLAPDAKPSPLSHPGLDEDIHIDERGHYGLRVDLPHLHNLIHLGDDEVATGGDLGVEVPGGLLADEVPLEVGLVGLDEADMGPDGPLDEVGPAMDIDLLFSLLDRGPEPDLRQESPETRPPRSKALGEGPLRDPLYLELPAVPLSEDLLIGADEGGRQLSDETGVDQAPHTVIWKSRVIGDDPEIPWRGISLHNGIDELIRDAHPPKARQGHHLSR